MNIAEPGDEIQRYVDILFADYRDQEPARRLRIELLNDLLLEKEQLRMEGLTEKEAVASVLTRLEQDSQPREGSLLVYADRFERDSAQSLLFWCLTGLIFSAPLLVLNKLLFPALFLIATLAAGVLAWRWTSALKVENVEFRTESDLALVNRRLWLGWLAITVIWLLAAGLLGSRFSGSLNPLLPALLRKALLWVRFYPPWLLLVFPLWASGRCGLLYKNEIGAEDNAPQKTNNLLQKLVHKN